MLTYAIRRLTYTLLVVLGVSLVTFVIFHVVGGSPALQMLGDKARPEDVRALERELGFDRPLPAQFLHHLGCLARLDFGESHATGQRVSRMILDGIGPSLALAVPAFLLGTILAIYIAVACALYRNTWFDRISVLLCVVGMSVTSLAIIIVGQYVLAYRFGWFPISGFGGGLSSVRYLVLPWLIWIGMSLGANVRFYRMVITEEMDKDYVTAAWARGLHPDTILFGHVLRNSLVPILTRIIMTVPFLYTGSLLLEVFFGIPGMGNMFLSALRASDYPVVRALTFIGSVLFVFANLGCDLCYGLVDPRIRMERGKT